MLETLKQTVCQANLELWRRNLVIDTWGNVSGVDRESGVLVIKPSGVPYDRMAPEDMVVVDLETGHAQGRWNPSSDTPTHRFLYRAFPTLGGIVHTHSPWAVSWAQGGRAIPCYGTTHADYFHGAIPCTRPLTREEIDGAYEENTGLVIAETVGEQDPLEIPAILCASHGPFTWGIDPAQAVHNAMVLEEVAKMAARTEQLSPYCPPAPEYLLDRHFFRKHGPNAYYGQKSGV